MKDKCFCPMCAKFNIGVEMRLISSEWDINIFWCPGCGTVSEKNGGDLPLIHVTGKMQLELQMQEAVLEAGKKQIQLGLAEPKEQQRI